MVWRGKNRKHPETANAWWHATAKAKWVRGEMGVVRPHPGVTTQKIHTPKITTTNFFSQESHVMMSVMHRNPT